MLVHDLDTGGEYAHQCRKLCMCCQSGDAPQSSVWNAPLMVIMHTQYQPGWSSSLTVLLDSRVKKCSCHPTRLCRCTAVIKKIFATLVDTCATQDGDRTSIHRPHEPEQSPVHGVMCKAERSATCSTGAARPQQRLKGTVAAGKASSMASKEVRKSNYQCQQRSEAETLPVPAIK